MGKATRWLKSLLGTKKENQKDNSNSEVLHYSDSNKKENKRWSFHKSSKIPSTIQVNDNSHAWLRSYLAENNNEQNKHAIVVAAATAAAADAAVAAAQAAVEVVRLTAGRRNINYNGREIQILAAVRMQSVFRGFLARKALRALKGLVKIQALVRGYLVRKRTAATLYSMHALVRAQAAARSQRARRSFNKENRYSNEFRGPRSMGQEKYDELRSEFHQSKRLSTSYEYSLSTFEDSPKIVEIDTYRPKSRSRRMSTPTSEYGEDPYYSSPLPSPLTSKLSIPKNKNIENYEYGYYEDDYKFPTAQSTPRFANSYKYNGPSKPSKSVCGDGHFRMYPNFPSYMASTQSFSAKLRSQSAPKQRPELISKKRISLDEILASRSSLSGVKMQRPCSQVQQTLNI